MNEKNDQYVEIDLFEILSLLKSHWLVIVFVTIIFGAIGYAGTEFLLTPQYEASVNMIVNTRADNTTTVSNDNISSAKSLVSTYAIIIKGNTVLNDVIDRLNLDMDYEELSAKVNVSAIDDTQVMKISVTDPDPSLAKQIVAEIARLSPQEIIDAVEAGSCKVISRVTATDEPISPSKTKNTAIAALLGMVIVVAIIVIRDFISNYIVDDNDIQKYLDLPVLGVIPEIEED